VVIAFSFDFAVTGPLAGDQATIRRVVPRFVRRRDVVYYFTICLVVFGVYLSYAKSCSFRRARVVAACDCARCRKKGNLRG
jgi:hypothetical protein